MRLRHLLMGSAALIGAAAAISAALAPHPSNLRHAAATAPGTARLVAFTARSLEQRSSPVIGKLDAALADLARHAPLATPGRELSDLHSMNPAARFRPAQSGAAPLVLIDAVTRGDARRLKVALAGLGLAHASVFANDVGGWLPVDRIADAAARPEVVSIHATMPRTRAATGILATQGDYAQRSSAVRAAYPTLTGAGITVGVLSDSFDCFGVYAQPNSGVPASGFSGYAYNGFTATAAQDEAGGALPPTVKVLAEPYTQTPTPAGDCLNYNPPDQSPFTDEGRAMLQVVHAVAPGARLAFYTGDDSEAAFANGILALAASGARIIADDLGYFDEPFYQDGVIAQAIDTVAASGVAYFSAAGNNADASWESVAPSFATLATGGSNAGEYLLNFDTSGATTATSLAVTVAPLVPGEYVGIVVEWDQPYVTGAKGSPGASSRIDVCVTGATNVYPIIQDYDGNSVTCTGANASGVDPVQILVLGNPANATGNTPEETLNLVVGLAGGTQAPGRLIVSVQTDGQTNPAPISTYATHSATLQGHPGAVGAAAVGAAFYYLTPQCGSTVAQLEPFSSEGGAPILFDMSGNRLATPVVRQKPDFVGPDGINTTFLGFQLASSDIDGIPIGSNGQLPTTDPQCQNDASYPNFFGTSAATPHAAGIAALMLQANPAVTPAQIYQALQQSALPMTGSGSTPNFYSGYGFIQADAALALLPPAPPTLSLAANSVAAGQSTTLTWSSTNTTSCLASGSWSGTRAASGTQTLTPTTVGTNTYTLSCGNATATSAQSSATLTVTAADPPSGGGGGGALDELALGGLLAALIFASIKETPRE
ncbi:MAG: S8 family serine peptidase [Steroidobacterales bacterium]